jgi:hypothetical protein
VFFALDCTKSPNPEVGILRKQLLFPALLVSFSFILSSCGGSADPAAKTASPPTANGQPSPAASSSGGDPGPAPPAGATLIDHIEDHKPWDHCSACAARPGRSNPPLASWDFEQFQHTPSLDGSSTKFAISGNTPYGNVLHITKFDGQHNNKHNFIFEFDIYASPESLNAQNLESDLFQGVASRKYMFGIQCNYAKNIWQGWNAQAVQWIDFPQAPCKKFEAGKWTHVKWELERTSDNKLHYVSVTVGNQTWKVDSYQPSVPASNGWDNALGVQFQQDLNIDAADYAIWIDQIKVWSW